MEQHIGKNIQTLRKERGVSQSDLAAALGVTVQAVSKWETGKANPDLYLLPRLADYFRVSIDRLFGRESPAPPRRRARIQPLISVLIPVYQVEEHLRRCLDSVLAQTYPNLEVLLVDDGSTDQSPVICQEYVDKAAIPVRYWRTNHQGVSFARQMLMDEAKGAYCFFLDSDDFIDPNTIEILYQLAVSHAADIVQCNVERTSSTELPKIDYDSGIVEVHSGDLMLDQFSCGGNLMRCMLAAKLYRREVFTGIKMPIGKIHEDEAVMHRMIGKCNTVVCTDLPLYRYYNNPHSLTKKTFSHARYDALDAILDREQYCREKGRDFAGDMNCLRFCLECVKMYRATVEHIGPNDPLLPELKKQYVAKADYLLSTGRMERDLAEKLRIWKDDPTVGERPTYFATAFGYYEREYGGKDA